MPKTPPAIAYDLDGTLAEYNGWVDSFHIGKPVQPIAQQFLKDIRAGKRVKILTARMSDMFGNDPHLTEAIIRDWLDKTFGKDVCKDVEITCIKGPDIMVFYDDRCIAVERNTGKIMYNPLEGK